MERRLTKSLSAPFALLFAVLQALQRLIEIGAKIANIFNADGKTHQRIVEAHFRAPFRRDRRMGHDAGMFDEAFYAAKAFREGEKFNPLQHGLGRVEATFHENGDHTAKSVHLALGDLMARPLQPEIRR